MNFVVRASFFLRLDKASLRSSSSTDRCLSMLFFSLCPSHGPPVSAFSLLLSANKKRPSWVMGLPPLPRLLVLFLLQLALHLQWLDPRFLLLCIVLSLCLIRASGGYLEFIQMRTCSYGSLPQLLNHCLLWMLLCCRLSFTFASIFSPFSFICHLCRFILAPFVPSLFPPRSSGSVFYSQSAHRDIFLRSLDSRHSWLLLLHFAFVFVVHLFTWIILQLRLHQTLSNKNIFEVAKRYRDMCLWY